MTDVATTPPRDTSDHGGLGDIQDAWRILAGGSVIAARALVSIAGDPEMPSASRVSASQTVLKMTGFGGPDTVMVPVVPREFDAAAPQDRAVTSAQIIRDRLALLAQTETAQAAEEAEVIDAVIVETPPYG